MSCDEHQVALKETKSNDLKALREKFSICQRKSFCFTFHQCMIQNRNFNKTNYFASDFTPHQIPTELNEKNSRRITEEYHSVPKHTAWK